MKLSEELGKWRCDRPDEWKMDEFQRNAEKLEAERDALAAQNKELLCYIADAEAWFNKHDPNGYVSPKRKQAQQHLAEIRAEAVERFADELAKRVEVPDASPTRAEYYKAAIRHVLIFANKHAAKVRKGGE